MQSSLAISTTFHIGILVVAYFGVPVLFEPPPAMTAPIPVELVTIDEITTPKVEEEPDPPKPQPKPEVKAKPEPVKEPPPKKPQVRAKPIAKPDLPSLPPPALPKETEVAALQPEPLPPPKPKEIVPPLEAKPEPTPPKPAAKPVPKPVAKPKPKPKPKKVEEKVKTKRVVRGPAPKPRARPQSQAKFDPGRISALLDKTPTKKAPPPPPPEEKKKRSVDDIKIKSSAQPLKLASAPTISEIDFIRRQLLDCWYLPGGAKDLQNMRVTIRVELSSDGTLMRPPVVVDRVGRNTTDAAFFRTFEESALRAVRACTDPKNPLQLPPGEANKWRDLEFTFDPRDMLG